MSSAKSRKKTTGRCESRAELVESVWYMVHHTPASIADVARALRVSHGTVHNILRTKEGNYRTLCLHSNQIKNGGEMITDEKRKAFEQWYMAQFGDKDMQTTESGNYFYVRHAAAWKSWQAAQQVKELDFTDATVEGWAIGGWAKSKCYRAKSSIGTYNVYDVEGQNGRYCFYSFDYESSDNYQTLDEAIAAANEDYRKRVLSCLVNGGV